MVYQLVLSSGKYWVAGYYRGGKDRKEPSRIQLRGGNANGWGKSCFAPTESFPSVPTCCFEGFKFLLRPDE